MSHFTVLVVAKDDDDLEQKLLPYHEYECTGIEEYTEFVPADMDELQADYDKHAHDGQSFDDFARDWAGVYRNEAGVLGRRTNPRAKWDWWVIGGRWTGTLVLKEPGMGRNGRPGVMTEPNQDPGRADIALAGDVDWEAMYQERMNYNRRWFTKRHRYMVQAREEELDAAYVAGYLEIYEDDDRLQEIFPTPRDYAYYKRADELARDDGNPLFFMIKYDQIACLVRGDLEAHMDEAEAQALTYAFVDTEGNWHQRGEMGWFGLDDKSRGTQNYDGAWWDFVQSLPDDQLVYIVDCHI